MGNYSKGAKFENEVITYLEKLGLYCIRSAGSKGIVDVIAFKRFTDTTFVYLIQCKYGKAKMSKKDKKILVDLANNLKFTPLYIFRKKHEKRLNIIILNKEKI